MKRSILFWIAVIWSGTYASGQPMNEIDSLYHAYQRATNDTVKIKTLYSLANAYVFVNMDSCLYFSETAFALSKKNHFTSGLLKGYNLYGRALINTGQYESSIELCKEGLDYVDGLLAESKDKEEQQKLKIDKSVILNNLGISFDLSANYPEALKYYTQRLQLDEALGDRKGIAGSYHNIGGVYLEYGKYDEALSYFQKAYALNKELGNNTWLTNNLTNIAIVYSYKEEYERALAKYREALDLYESMGNDAGMLTTLLNIGSLYVNTENADSAIYYLQKTLKLNASVEDPRTEANAYLYLGRMYTLKNDYSRARSMLEKADPLVHEIGHYERLNEYYYTLFMLDTLQGNYSSAIRNLQLYHMYLDSVYNEDNIRKLTQTEMNYNFEKKEAKAKAEQDKKDVIAAKELQRQKLIRNGFSGGFAVVLIFSGIFMRQRNKIKIEKSRSDGLLLNILPAEVAEELKEKGNAEAKMIDGVTVLFTDFKGFTQLSEKLSPQQLVAEIDECFSAFDLIMQRYGVEKIKTIGDAYMAAGGLPVPNATHPVDVVGAALEIQKFMLEHKSKKQAAGQLYFEARIGIHTGPVVAGIVGIKKFAYDIWGDTVNTASRMETFGEAGKVNISEGTYELVKDKFICTHRGQITAKGKGEMDMYFVEGQK